LGLGSFLSLDAPSADEETAGVAAETAAEESAEVEEVFVLTIGLIILILAVSF
jgi:hypothetical protein